MRCREVFLFGDVVFEVVECGGEFVVAFVSSQVFPVALADC